MMRFSLCVLLLSLVVLSSLVSAVPVPYGLCSSAGAHVKILTVSADEWPPKSGDTMHVNMTGTLNKNITDGGYTIDVSIDGIPITPITGDIDHFKPTPWYAGALNMSFDQAIPGGIPSGTKCVLEISAIDQDKQQLFCIKLSFTFEMLEAPKTVSAFQAVPAGGPKQARNGGRHHRAPMIREDGAEAGAAVAPPPINKHTDGKEGIAHAKSHSRRVKSTPMIKTTP